MQLQGADSPPPAQKEPEGQFEQLAMSGDAVYVPAKHAAHVTTPVMTRFPVPDAATVANWSFPKVTPAHELSAAEGRLVHVLPSGEVMTRFPVPDWATATKRLFPNATPVH